MAVGVERPVATWQAKEVATNEGWPVSVNADSTTPPSHSMCGVLMAPKVGQTGSLREPNRAHLAVLNALAVLSLVAAQVALVVAPRNLTNLQTADRQEVDPAEGRSEGLASVLAAAKALDPRHPWVLPARRCHASRVKALVPLALPSLCWQVSCCAGICRPWHSAYSRTFATPRLSA